MPTFELPPFIKEKAPWPPPGEKERLENIASDRQLFGCDHREVFEEHYKRLRRDGTTSDQDPRTLVEFLAKLSSGTSASTFEQEINLPHALSVLWADLLVSKPPRFRPEGGADERAMAAVKRLTDGLDLEVHESVIEQSVAGNFVYVTYLEQGRARIESYPADQWIPWKRGKRILAHVLFSVDEDGDKQYISFEVHYPPQDGMGHIKYRRFELAGDALGREVAPILPVGVDTPDQDLPGLSECTVQVGANLATSVSPHGIGDYRAIETLIPQMNVQSSQWGMIFDKHSAPTMFGPASVLEYDETLDRWVYKTAPDGKYIPIESGEEKPGYLTWDAQMQANFAAWDRLLEIFYTVTGTTPAAFSNHKDGGAASGTALRLRMARPLEVAGRKRARIDPALRRALLAAQQLEVRIGGQSYTPVPVLVEWRDGLPIDPKERADTEAIRKNAGLTTTKRSLMRLDDLPEEEAEREAEEIAAERAAEAGAGGIFMPGASQGLNGPDDGGGEAA